MFVSVRCVFVFFFFFSSRRRHTRFDCDWSSDVCSSDLNRSILKVATHQDYEMAVLRLLAGERGYASLEPAEVQDALRREAGESHPDAGLFRHFPHAILSLNRLAAERSLPGDRADAPQ